MDFFQEVFNTVLRNGDTMQMAISKKDGNLVVVLMPGVSSTDSNNTAYMVPLVLSGNPQELDACFFEKISEPFAKALGYVANVKQFEAGLSQSRSNSTMAKSEKRDIDKMLQDAENYKKANKFSLAIATLNKAKEIPGADKNSIEKRIKALQGQAGVGTLFGSDASEEEETLSCDITEQEEE